MMPFDGLPSDYEVKKPNTFSAEGMVAWLETQNLATQYRWSSSTDCLICRFSVALGGQTYSWPKERDHLELNIAMPEPWTYGAALTRARALMESVATQGRE